MPCASSMKATKLIWLNKINLVESAAHLLMLEGGAAATRLEWIDADQFSEMQDGPFKVLGHVSTWKELPRWATREAKDINAAGADGAKRLDAVGETSAALGRDLKVVAFKGIVDPESGAEHIVEKIATVGGGNGAVATAASSLLKPMPGFKVIEGLVYSWNTRRQLPAQSVLDTWQLHAAQRVAAMMTTKAGTGRAAADDWLGDADMSSAGQSEAGDRAGNGGEAREDRDGGKDAAARLGVTASATPRPLPLADRIQIGCYAPQQRVGPCTSNYFVASRFRATLFGIAAMRQAFEDVIFDFAEEFPAPGFGGWNVYNLSWADHLDASFDRPGYPSHGGAVVQWSRGVVGARGPG